MTVFTKPAAEVFAPTEADGTLRGANMGEAQIWGTEMEYLANLAYTSSLVYSTRAALYANLVPGANTPALVIGDPTAGYDGLYMKVGATTTGSWTRLGDVPGYSFIKATDVGAGTANAIVATSTAIPSADGGALIALNIFETNTSTPVTVAFNGGSALTIKTNAGNDVATGGLTAGMIVAGYVSGSTFRLLSDQASAAVVAAAEAAQAAAQAAQAAAEAARDAALAAVPAPIVLDRTAMLALDTGTTTNSFLAELGREGHFTWDSSNLALTTLLGPSLVTSTFPDTETFTYADHGLRTGMPVVTTSANGFVPNTLYWTIELTTPGIAYEPPAGGSTVAFTVGKTLTDGTATATIVKIDDRSDGTGVLWLSNITGTFTAGATLTETDGSGTSMAMEANTTYPHTDNFKLASSFANAQAGTAITMTGSASITIRRHFDPEQGIYVTPTAAITGATGAWVRKGFAVWDKFPATWFGMSTSGTAAANQQALQGAINFGPTFLPQGSFDITGKIRALGGVTLVGIQGGMSRLVWDGSATDGFDVRYTDDYEERVVFEGIEFITEHDGTANCAILLDMRAQILSGGIFRRFWQRGHIKHCRFAGLSGPATHGWYQGIDFLSCCQFFIENNSWVGKFTTSEATIISDFFFRSRGTGHPAEIDINNNTVSYFDRAIVLNGENEGINIGTGGHNRFMAGNTGISATVTIWPVRSSLMISNNHFNCKLYGVNVSNYEGVSIIGNNFLQRNTTAAAGGGVILTDCANGSITGNQGNAQYTATGGLAWRGVVLAGDTHGFVVSGNQWNDVQYAVWAQTDTYDNVAYGNIVNIQANTGALMYLDGSTTAAGNALGGKRRTAESSAAVTAGTTGDLCTVNFGTVHAGQTLRASGLATVVKGAAAGQTSVFISKDSGTATLVAYHDSTELRHRLDSQGASTTATFIPNGEFRITGSGTLVLKLAYSATGAVDIAAGAAQLAISDVAFSQVTA